LLSSCLTQTRIKIVPQPVTHEIHSHNHEKDGNSGKKENLVHEAALLRHEGEKVRSIADKIGVNERHVYRLLKEAKDIEYDFSRRERWSLKDSLCEPPEKTAYLIGLQAHEATSKGVAEWAWQISKMETDSPVFEDEREALDLNTVLQFATLLENAEDDWQYKLIARLLEYPPLGELKHHRSRDYLLFASGVVDPENRWQWKYACYALYKILNDGQPVFTKPVDVVEPDVAQGLSEMFMEVYKNKDFRAVMTPEAFK